MAFITPTACTAATSRASSTAKRSRRDFLQLATVAGVAALLPAPSIAQDVALPPGAAQFNRLLGAQKQWASLSEVLARSELTDTDWDNLRGYLRTVYAVSGDMEFIAKPWEKRLKDEGVAVAGRFRTTVKGMDKPAIRRDVAEFRKMHGEVVGLFDDFFEVFKNATVSDIPDEL